MSDDQTKARIAYYRERAAEARAKAGTMKDCEARQTMLPATALGVRR
jgi:hypothetical protein